MESQGTRFGYYPLPLSIDAGSIEVQTLPGLEETVTALSSSKGIEGNWIYAPTTSRIFGLPKTHILRYSDAESNDHIRFLIWALSFFLGIRLTTTDAGFLDATPIKPGELVDFMLERSEGPKTFALANSFWAASRRKPVQQKRFIAAVHALFLGQSPRSLQFERFIFLYAALDACFALASSLHSPERLPHAARIEWMCDLFGMMTPDWGTQASSNIVVSIRNTALHEALFMGEPLGFAVNQTDLLREMEALICRLLVALMGGPSADYVRTPINTRQRHLLQL